MPEDTFSHGAAIDDRMMEQSDKTFDARNAFPQLQFAARHNLIHVYVLLVVENRKRTLYTMCEKKKKKNNECTRKSGPSVEFYGRSYSIVRQKISLPIRGESKTVLLDNTDSWFHLKIDMSTALHSYDKFVVYRSDHLALVATIALNNQSTESSDGSIVSECKLGKWS